MADYAIVQDLTNYGVELMQSNPSVANNLIIQADAHTKLVTNNNYGISGTRFDYLAGLVWYDLQPLTISAQAEMQQASLGNPSLGFLDIIKNIIAYAIPVGVGIIAGAIAGGIAGSGIPILGTAVGAFIGAIAGAAIGLGIDLFGYLSQKIELEQSQTDIKKQLTDMLERGDITPEEYDNAVDSVDKGMTAEIPWTKIIIGGMIGLGALAAFYIFLQRKR